MGAKRQTKQTSNKSHGQMSPFTGGAGVAVEFDDPAFMSVAQAAEVMGVDRRRLYSLIRRGSLPAEATAATVNGGSILAWRLRRDEVLAFAEAQKQAALAKTQTEEPEVEPQATSSGVSGPDWTALVELMASLETQLKQLAAAEERHGRTLCDLVELLGRTPLCPTDAGQNGRTRELPVIGCLLGE